MWIRCSMLRRSWARGSGQIGQVRASGQLHKQGTVTLKQGAGEADQTEHGHKNTGSGAPGSCRAAFMIVSDRRRIIFICGRAHGKAHHTPVAKRVKGHTLRYNLTLSHSASPRHTLHNSITGLVLKHSHHPKRHHEASRTSPTPSLSGVVLTCPRSVMHSPQ